MEADIRSVTCKSGRIITIRELNGLEQTNADRYANAPYAMASYRLAYAIVSIDGKKQPTADDGGMGVLLEARLQKLKGSELSFLLDAYNKAFETTPTKLGNESSNGEESPDSSTSEPSA